MNAAQRTRAILGGRYEWMDKAMEEVARMNREILVKQSLPSIFPPDD